MKKKEYLTILSVISAIAVVMLHTNGCFWRFSYERYWFTANIIESVMYFAVPVFFMISGATLLDYSDKYSTKVYFIKRLKKTFVPFVIWSLIGVLYLLFTKSISINELLPINVFFSKLINCGFISIYWFFIPLFLIYLTIPVLSSISKEKRIQVYSYLVIVCLVFNYIFPFLFQILNIQYNSTLSFALGTNYVVYICIGYLLDNLEIDKKYRFIVYFLAIFSLLVMIVGTYKLSIQSGEIISTYKGYQKLPCLLYSIGIFLFVKNISKYFSGDLFMKIVNWLSSYTFPLYLLHWFIMNIMLKMFNINTLSIIYRIFVPFLIFIINIFITCIIRKLPFGKDILP